MKYSRNILRYSRLELVFMMLEFGLRYALDHWLNFIGMGTAMVKGGQYISGLLEAPHSLRLSEHHHVPFDDNNI